MRKTKWLLGFFNGQETWKTNYFFFFFTTEEGVPSASAIYVIILYHFYTISKQCVPRKNYRLHIIPSAYFNAMSNHLNFWKGAESFERNKSAGIHLRSFFDFYLISMICPKQKHKINFANFFYWMLLSLKFNKVCPPKIKER